MSLPENFIKRMALRYSENSEAVLDSFEGVSPTSILLHPDKAKSLISSDKGVQWNEWGRYLDERPAFIADPLYHAGSYYSQDASSMFVGHALSELLEVEDPFVLDLCAAPGGKSLDILNVIGEKGFLLSNEIIRSRNAILRENIAKWGRPNTAVSQNEAADLARFGGLFDAVVVDAPCSGEGLFRKDPKARSEWSPEAVEFCSSRQRKILAEIAPAVKNGGLLLYSTCTFASEENEAQFDFLTELGFENVDVPIAVEWNIEVVQKDGCKGYAFLPHRVKGEGLFLTVFRKTVPSTEELPRRKEERLIDYKGESLTYLSSATNEELYLHGESVFHIPEGQDERAKWLLSLARITQLGVRCATVSKGRVQPAHEVALSNLIVDTQPTIELTLEQSLRFLRGETFSIDTSHSGFLPVTYQGAKLGWIKMAAGRMKNHYPKGWRIRKEMKALL